MTKDDMLTRTRTRLTQSREKITEYENLWKEYQRTEYSKHDVENTFKELLFNFKNLLWEVEILSISHESLNERVNILEKFLYQSTDNPIMKNELDNELRNLREKYETQSKSFLKYFDKENQ